MAINHCPHQGKFFCTTVTTEEGKTYAYACLQRCGFWLNFDPVFAGAIKEKIVPFNIALDSWRLNTVAFLPHPDTTREWKTPQPMAQEGIKMRKDGP